MKTREDLQSELEELLGSTNVYFQPPESIKLKYPCIIYNLSSINARRADNSAYTMTNRYSLTLIDKNPNSSFIRELLGHFPMCSFDRSFISNKLNHFVFDLYY